jgi:hypothetical protein
MNEEIKALRSEVALLKLQFSERLGQVEDRLNTLLVQESSSLESTSSIPFTAAKAQPLIANLASSQSPDIKTSMEYELAGVNETLKTEPSKPSFITILCMAILSSLIDWFSPVTEIYQSYKERGMLGIFILTIAGIGLTLAGFGYLMQLLIDQLGAGSKSLLMGLAAILVMAVGISLKIKTRFSEFATAIVTLGILLLYSTVYFSGSVYGILPGAMLLFLYLSIAILCHVLALWLDTKVVVSLGIIGIATMPILSGTVQIQPLYYLLSLAFVAASSLIFAYRLSQQWLVNLSLAFSVVAIEWIISFEAVQISAWTLNLFYLLFFFYVAMTLFRQRAAHNSSLIFLASVIGSTAILFVQAADLFSGQMSVCFVLNAAIAAAIASLFYKVKHPSTHFLILVAALWSVIAFVSAISDAYWGLAWAAEGLLLLTIGRRYVLSNVINQGQVLTAIALIYCWAALVPYFPLPALFSTDGWILSIVILAVIAIWQRMIEKSDAFDDIATVKIKPLLQLLEMIWLSILLIACSNIWIGQWTSLIVMLFQTAILFRARYCKQVSLEIFAASLILVPLYYANQGALAVDSYRFMALPLTAKLSLIVAFVQLWLWSEFYRNFQPESKIKGLAESARITFYLLIPICWVSSTVRRLDENALMLIWISPLVAFMLAHKIKHQLLIAESKLLTGLASLAFVLVVGQLNLLNSLVALCGFMIFYGLAYLMHRRTAEKLNEFITSWGILSLGFAIPFIIGVQTNNIYYGAITASVYWALCFNTINFSVHLQRNEIFITLINILLIAAAWLMTLSNSIYATIPGMFLLAAVYTRNNNFIDTRLGKLFGLNSDLLLHSILAMSYSTLFASLHQYRLDLLIAPVLAIHGALILFLKDKRISTVKYSFAIILLGIIKLALIDAANALLWQKVVLFMGIGVFILIASFWYQKLVTKTELQV